MKNNQQGFIVPLLLTIIALIIVGGGVYVYKNNKTQIATIGSTSTASSRRGAVQTDTVQAPVTTTTTATVSSTIPQGWSLYEESNDYNGNFKLSFYKPATAKVTVDGSDVASYLITIPEIEPSVTNASISIHTYPKKTQPNMQTALLAAQWQTNASQVSFASGDTAKSITINGMKGYVVTRPKQDTETFKVFPDGKQSTIHTSIEAKSYFFENKDFILVVYYGNIINPINSAQEKARVDIYNKIIATLKFE